METTDALERRDDVAERPGGNVIAMDRGRRTVWILVGQTMKRLAESVRGSQSRINDGEPCVVLDERRFMCGGPRRTKADGGSGDQCMDGDPRNAGARCRLTLVQMFDRVRRSLTAGLAP